MQISVFKKPETEVKENFTIYSRMHDGNYSVMLPPQFVGMRFSLGITHDGNCVLTKRDDSKGTLVHKAVTRNYGGRLVFGQKWLPYVLKHSEKETGDAIWDGKTIVFKFPRYTPSISKPVKQTKSLTTNTKDKLDQIRDAVNALNDLVTKYGVTLAVENGTFKVYV